MPALAHAAELRWRDRVSLQPDLSRAIRATIAFMVPLLAASGGWLPLNVFFTAIAAQNLAMVDVRGDYRFRLALLLAMTAVFVGAAALGTACAHDLTSAILATIFIVVCGSVWRHLSSDYGPGLAMSSTFVFLFALATSASDAAIANHIASTLVGGIWGTVVQVALWPFLPQHPLRRAVSDSWLAVAELFEAIAPTPEQDATSRHRRVMEKEAALRTALDATTTTLAGIRHGTTRTRLEALNFAAGRLALRVTALASAVEALESDAGLATLTPALEPLLTNLSNLSRTIAVAVVSRQPAHLVTAEVRLRRAAALLATVRRRFALHAADAAASQLAEILTQIEAHLPAMHEALRATIARANERAAWSLELLDLRNLALRPLASALNLSWKVDPALVRFTVRTAILVVLGVVAFKHLQLPHGYWLPFTVVVVLQPDYGSTRRRAAQRMLGTLAGSVLGSLLLWLHLPLGVIMAASTATIFTFGYWIKRNYGVAVIFITLFVVLLTEAAGPVTLALTIERLGTTVAGGLLALLAAQLFWPAWERERLPPILVSGLEANRDYLRTLVARVMNGNGFDSAVLACKRHAERANSAAFSSLNRLAGEPRNQREGLERAATLANGNQRITRALNVLAVHLPREKPWNDPALSRFVSLADQAFTVAAAAVETTIAPTAELDRFFQLLEADPLPVPPQDSPPARWAFAQLTQVATELSALLLALREDTAEGSTGRTFADDIVSVRFS